ncbi:histidine kinase [Tenacibaculum soleae]|uniref:histidine kinase n=1 Tax=Tenacibaculum soleae TaxID=447689 RepID=UPI002300BB5B|nr:histidine kinase [Tenacibaculum soleae]
MKKYFYFVFIVLFASCKYDIKQADTSSRVYKEVFEISFKIGDDINWKSKNFDHSKWSQKKTIPNGEEIFWARNIIKIIKPLDSLKTIGINIHAFGAYEVFWDGVLIGKNGTPGNEASTQKTGTTTESFVIPNNLLELGNHSVALRMSQLYEKNDSRSIYIYIDNYKDLVTVKLKDTIYIHILAGAFLLASIYYFLLFINDRKQYAMLLFSLSSLLFFLLIILEYIKFYLPIHYSNFLLRLKIIGILTLFLSFLVPYYFAVQFSFKYRKSFFFVYTILLIGIHLFYSKSYDLTALLLSQMMWLYSTVIICYAIFQKQKAAIIVLIGLLGSFVIYKISIYDISLFVSFAIISLFMFYLLSVKLKEQRLAYENSLVQSTRLKLELLKKSIQPHFLMNTLTSLIDWVEEAPDKGVLFIEALADEFDVLNQVENETLIPISQEIKLCKSHISIMKFRKEIEYVWEDEGVNENVAQLIPPAVIHTLLENSITHCLPSDENQLCFKLIVFTTKNTQEYKFLTFGKVRNQQKNTADGTGFKYIKARLTESYGDKWTFTSCQTNEGWKNTITIQK